MENTVVTKPELSPRERQLEHLIPYKPGQSGNPAGRPKGSRSKLNEDFLTDWFEDYQKHGKEVIETVRKKHPEKYFEALHRLLPKDIKIEIPQLNKIAHIIVDMPNQLNELTDDEPIDLLPVDTQPIDPKPVTESNR